MGLKLLKLIGAEPDTLDSPAIFIRKLMKEIILYILLGIFCLVEMYYWFMYFPACWRGEKSNQEIDNIKCVVTSVYGKNGSLNDNDS